jgi:hypothetical protein
MYLYYDLFCAGDTFLDSRSQFGIKLKYELISVLILQKTRLNGGCRQRRFLVEKKAMSFRRWYFITFYFNGESELEQKDIKLEDTCFGNGTIRIALTRLYTDLVCMGGPSRIIPGTKLNNGF